MGYRATLPFAAIISVLSFANGARAHSEYVQYIPNGGLNQCANCHPDGNELALNLFGQETLPHVLKPKEQWWPLMRSADSDGDGQTNAQELGDPCEEWLIGLEPGRKTGISNPGDAADLSPTPDVPSCDDPTGSGGAGGGTTTTGTTTSGTGTTSGDGSTSGAGAGGPTGGQGGTTPSVGAGPADEPIPTDQTGACSIRPRSSSLGGALAPIAALLLLVTRSRRQRSNSSK